MPIRRSPANRSAAAPASAATRAMITPAVRHEIRINELIVVFEHATPARPPDPQRTRVCAAPCRAHGTAAVTTPCAGQATRGASASR